MTTTSRFWLSTLALAVVLLAMSSCTSDSTDISSQEEFARSSTSSLEPAPETSTTEELVPVETPDNVFADPFLNQLFDRSDQVYGFKSLLTEKAYAEHVDCVAASAINSLGAERLADPAVLDSASRLSYDTLQKTEVEALIEAFDRCRRLRIYAITLLSLEAPRFASCIYAAIAQAEAVDELAIAASNGDSLASLAVVRNQDEACRDAQLKSLSDRVTDANRSERLNVAEQMITAAEQVVSFTPYERQCALLSVADRLSNAFVDKYTNSSNDDVLEYIAETQQDLHTRDSRRLITDGWGHCVLMADLLDRLVSADLSPDEITCLDSQRDLLDTTFAFSAFVSGFSTAPEAADVLLELAEKCG